MRGLWWFGPFLLIVSLATAAGVGAEQALEDPRAEAMDETPDEPADRVELAAPEETDEVHQAAVVHQEVMAQVIANVTSANETLASLPAAVPVPPGSGPEDEAPEESASEPERTSEHDPAEEDEAHEPAVETVQRIVRDEVSPVVPRELRPLLPPLVPTLDTEEVLRPDREGPPAPLKQASTEAATTASAIRTAEPSAAPAAIIAVAVAAASGGALVLKSTTPGLRALASLRRWLWIPLYARVAKDRVLDHETRQDIVAYLRSNPGVCVTEIQEVIGLSINAVTHHLRVLESNDMVQSVKSGRRRCFFASGDGLTARTRLALATLSSDAVRRVYSMIQRRPGICQQELADALGVSPTSVVFHARRLEDAGVVERARCGRALAYFPAVMQAERA